MSSFFERNKKKGLLAALLLLLRRGKGVVALLVLVAILSLLFVLPGGLRVPWASRLAERAGFAGIAQPGARFADMAQAIQSVREGDSQAGGARRRLAAARGKIPDGSTRASLELISAKLPTGETGAGLPQAETVAGIVNPADVDRRDRGVPLRKEELLRGLVRSAEAGTMAPPGGFLAAGPMPDAGASPDPGSVSLDQASAINPDAGIEEAALNFGNVPKAGRAPKLPARESFSKKDIELKGYKVDRSMMGVTARAKDARWGKPFYELAEARAYSVVAAPPTCAEPGCPKEYAAVRAGMVFDAAKGGEKIMKTEGGAADFNETAPSLPDEAAGQVQLIKTEGETYFDNAKKCLEAENSTAMPGVRQTSPAPPAHDSAAVVLAKFPGWNGIPDEEKTLGRAERILMKEMQHQSCKIIGYAQMTDPAEKAKHKECEQWAGDTDHERCSADSCDKNKAAKCKNIGNDMRDICEALNDVFWAKYNSAACPLASGQVDLHDCDQ